MRPREYFLNNLIALGSGLGCALILYLLLQTSIPAVFTLPIFILLGLTLLFFIATFAFTSASRLRDIGVSHWWIVLLLIFVIFPSFNLTGQFHWLGYIRWAVFIILCLVPSNFFNRGKGN